MTFHDKYAIVCLSKDRHDHAFKDLPLCENLRCNSTVSVCGFRIIDIETFSIIEEFTFDDSSGVTELYDVVCLPGYRSRILSNNEVDAIRHYDKIIAEPVENVISDIFYVSNCEEPVYTGQLPGQNSSLSDDSKIVVKKDDSHDKDDDDPYFLAEPASF